jgi:hypothetical protein
MSRAVRLICRSCDWRFVMDMPGQVPPCPKCGWEAIRTADEPEPLKLTVNDLRFLRVLRISAS